MGQFKGNKLKFNKSVNRQTLLELLVKEKPSVVAMEACVSAQHFARTAQPFGHDVILLDPLSVKAFRQSQKTDANDAIAIAVASLVPNVRSCKILTIEEQALQSLSKVRALADKQKIQLLNQIRGMLLEFGIVINQSEVAFKAAIPDILEDAENTLPLELKHALALSYSLHKQQCENKVELQKQIERIAKQNDGCQRLMALEGVGPITAIELLSFLGNTTQFSDGRSAAACAGMTPLQHSTGGKTKIGRILKRRGGALRRNLFLGARSVVSKLKNREATTEKERWIKNLLIRKGVKCAAIALANKTMRTAYALLKNSTTYELKPLTI